MSRLSELLGTLENLKGQMGRQELDQIIYGINVFQHLEDGGEFNSISEMGFWLQSTWCSLDSL